MNTVLVTIISFALIGSIAGVILFLIAKRFRVVEDPGLMLFRRSCQVQTAVAAVIRDAGVLRSPVSKPTA
jgi:hypothetical protein